MSRKSEDEIQMRIEKYAVWRQEHNWPQFEPANGICWTCGKQIFKIYDGTEDITGCPYCHRSYCE